MAHVTLLLDWTMGLLLLASAPGNAPVEGDLLSRNRQAWEAFQRKDFARAESLARETWTRADSTGSSLQAAFAAANLGAALALRGCSDRKSVV